LNLLPTKARDARPRVNGDGRASRRQARGGGGLFYREFPPEILRRRQPLAFVKDPDDLAAKYPQAIAWFREAIEAVDERLVRHRIFESRDATTDLGNDHPARW